MRNDMKRDRGSRGAVRLIMIAVLVAGALGVTALAAWPHVRERLTARTEGNSPAGTAAGGSGENAGNASGSSAGSSGSSDEGLITYDGRKYAYNSHLSNYLLLGVDTRGDISEERETREGGQSDAIFLVSYDRLEETVRLLAIPRDTMTTIAIYDRTGHYVTSMEDHITLQYAYGDGREQSCRLAVEAVSNLLYDVPILGYTAINLESIPYLADAVGGVPLTVPDDSLEEVDPAFKKGAEITLDAETTERFLRYRDTHSHQQALVRMERQKTFIRAFADRVLELQSRDPHTVTDVYETLKPYMVTNMSNDIYLDLDSARQEGAIETIPGEGVATDLYDEYHVDDDALFLMILDMFYIEQ